MWQLFGCFVKYQLTPLSIILLLNYFRPSSKHSCTVLKTRSLLPISKVTCVIWHCQTVLRTPVGLMASSALLLCIPEEQRSSFRHRNTRYGWVMSKHINQIKSRDFRDLYLFLTMRIFINSDCLTAWVTFSILHDCCCNLFNVFLSRHVWMISTRLHHCNVLKHLMGSLSAFKRLVRRSCQHLVNT